MDSSSAAAGRARTALLAVVTLILTVAALRLTRPVMLPLVAGVFLAVLGWPIRRRLRNVVPGPAATLGAFFAVLAVFAGFVASLVWMTRRITDAVPRYRTIFENTYAGVGDWLRSRGLPAPSGAPADSDWAANLARTAAADLASTGGLLLLMFAFFGLGLAEVADFQRKAGGAFDRPQARRLFATVGEIAEQWRIYVVAKTVTSALTGFVTMVFCLLVGLDLAFVWGFIAFLLEYVPTIGSTLAVVPPALFAIVQFGLGAKALLIAGGVAVLQIVMGNFVDPRIEARFVTLSPVVVLFAIVFWGWLWGALGALLGVPLTAAVLIACRHFEPTAWIAALFAEQRPAD